MIEHRHCQTKRLAIIPARGGSKRIPNKNIRNFHGKPIMIHALNLAKSSQIFSEIHVSTEDDMIASMAARYGFAPIFKRPSYLADDYTPLMPVLQYVAQAYRMRGQDFRTIAMLSATAVLIDEQDLQQACLSFEQDPLSRPLIAIASFPAPIEWAFKLASDNSLHPQQPGAAAIRSQDLSQSYFDTGSFAFFDSSMLATATSSWLEKNMRGYILPRFKAVDIDHEEDWQQMEYMFMVKHKLSHA